MALVPTRPGIADGYWLDLRTPRQITARRRSVVQLFVRNARTGVPERQFEIVHERPLHLFVVSGDLTYFAHLHPTLRGTGAFAVDLNLPHEGPYQVIADFAPVGVGPQLIQKTIVTAGYKGPLLHPAEQTVDMTAKIDAGTRVKLTMPDAIAGREQLVTFELTDERTGSFVDDLEPYLGATGHLLVVSADLIDAFHSHPVAELSATHGVEVFQVLFPRAGIYRIWAQFQRHGRVLTFAFTVPVAPAD